MVQAKSASTLKVITVDDSPLIAQRLELLLREVAGVSLKGNAETIPMALAIIESHKPHVIILDINLRKDDPRNGIDLLNLVKKTYPIIKVIMLTNLTGARYQILCKAFGADYFLDKSHDFDKIPETLYGLHNERWISECEKWWMSKSGSVNE